MSSKPQSSTKPVTHTRAKQTFLVPKIPVGPTDEALLQDLQKNYVRVVKVSRLHDQPGKPVGAILIDFSSEVATDKLLTQGYISFMGERHEVRPHFVRICDHCQAEGHRTAQCPHVDLNSDESKQAERRRRPADSSRLPFEFDRCHREECRTAQHHHARLTEHRVMCLFQQQQR